MQFGYSSFGGFLHWGRSLQRSCLYQTFFIMMLLSLFLFLFTGRGASGVDSINRKFLSESFLSNAVFPCALASAASVRRDSNPIVRAENDSRHSKAPSLLSRPLPPPPPPGGVPTPWGREETAPGPRRPLPVPRPPSRGGEGPLGCRESFS